MRIDDGILRKNGEKTPPARREGGKLTDESLEGMKRASEEELGPWYAVHHGYEVQIYAPGDDRHRTGVIYSMTATEQRADAPSGEWNTMEIELDGERVRVRVNGVQVTDFDPATPVPPREKPHEPERGPRPTHGYIGLQNHDDASRVAFREVSVRPLRKGR